MTKEEQSEWNLGDKVIFIPNMLVSYPECLPEQTAIRHRIISVGSYACQKGYDLLMEV